MTDTDNPTSDVGHQTVSDVGHQTVSDVGHQPMSDVGRKPMSVWCECMLTETLEIKTITKWAAGVPQPERPEWDTAACEAFKTSIDEHLDLAKEAAKATRWFRGTPLESARSHLDAAEADLLHLAPADYVVGQMPSIVNHVCRHLPPTDSRRHEVERIAKQVAAHDARDVGRRGGSDDVERDKRATIVNDERGAIVGAVRGASTAALREQTRLRSFRNVVRWATGGMLLVAVGLVVIGIVSPKTVPLCFAPESGDEVTVVCPTEQSGPIPDDPDRPGITATEVDAEIGETVSEFDIAIVAVLGAAAAAVAAAATIRKLRGSSEAYDVPIALALLKLPTGAVTAVLGLVLMRGGFVPGLSALDTSAQILAWAGIFGYAQQLFTRLVDQQANTVLDSVRGGDNAIEARPST